VPYAVYILSNPAGNVLYTGFTGNLQERILAHREKLADGFTKRYNVTRLVYYETTEDREAALAREKQIKAGSRAKKVTLIQAFNPSWLDLYDDL
jgi:putative endonuclease